jgi:hypothetical protein
LATVENELKNEKEENKNLKKRLTDAQKWIDNARRMKLQQMFDGMTTKMWDAKEMEDEKKKKDDQGCSKDMAKK